MFSRMASFLFLIAGGLSLGLSPAQAVAQERGADGLYAGEVTASKLNLRAGPGEAYQTVVAVDRGTRLVVVGPHANDPSWVRLEVPGGFDAWVFGRFVDRDGDRGVVTAERLQIRPRPTTKYHQLGGVLQRGERVEVTGEKRTKSGLWYRVRIPQRVPLYAAVKHLRNVGGPELARKRVEARADDAGADDSEAIRSRDTEPAKGRIATSQDKRFLTVEGEIRRKLATAKSTGEVRQLKAVVSGFDRKGLSLENRERRVRLLADLVEREHKYAIAEVRRKEEEIKGDLDVRLAEIDREYRRRLAEIRKKFEEEEKPRFAATGIVRHAPDLLGRYPAFRIEEAGKMKYYLIAQHYDLGKFSGKRVGVTGIKDPESGTGYRTIMVKRIVILGDK